MELETQVESLDNIPEALHPLYTQDDKGYKLNVNPEALEEALVPGLKSALQKERTNFKDLSRQHKDLARKLEAFGEDDPQAILQELVDLRRQAEKTKNKDSKGDDAIEQIKKQLNDSHRKELDAVINERDAVTGQLKSLLVDSAATSMVSELKGTPKLLLPHIKNMTEVIKGEDGKFQVRVLNEEGQHRVNKNGDFMTIRELVEEMRSDAIFARAFDGEGASGGGTSSGAHRGGGSALQKRSKMTVEQKADFIAKNGQEGYLKLPWD